MKRLSRAEVRDYFNISESTLQKWIRRGWIAAPTHFGRQTWWFESSVKKTEQRFLDLAEENLKELPRIRGQIRGRASKFS